MAVEIIAVAIPAIGASGEDDVDEHAHAFLKTERYAGPRTGGRRTASCGQCEKAIMLYNVHFVRHVNGHKGALRAYIAEIAELGLVAPSGVWKGLRR